jgi:hypothetical protein
LSNRSGRTPKRISRAMLLENTFDEIIIIEQSLIDSLIDSGTGRPDFYSRFSALDFVHPA